MRTKTKMFLICVFISVAVILLASCQESANTNMITNNVEGELLFAYGKDGLYILKLPTKELNNIIESEISGIIFPSYPSWSPNGKEIVLSQYKEGTGLLTIISMISRSKKELNDIKLDCDYPSWSPNGEYIAFLGRPIKSGRSDYKLYILSTRDLEYRVLPSALVGPYRPTWSPDSSSVMLSSYDHRVLIINLYDRKAEEIIPFGASPAWSPDGKFIVYRGRHSVYLYNLESRSEKELILNLGFSDVRDFAWSPDSKFIVFKRLSESRSPIEIVSLDSRTKIKLKEFGNLRGLSWKY